MRKVREVLRLKQAAHLSNRQIARCLGIARSTVADYLSRAEQAGLRWPLPGDLDEATLDRLLFAEPPPMPRSRRGPLPDWNEVHHELSRKGVTLQLVHQEYKAQHPDGYQYSRFCELYRHWRSKLDLVMRQSHRAGEKLFVDYAGQTVPVIDATTGQRREAQIFVAVLGASNFTYAEATWTQTLPDWIASHQRAFQFFGGVPEIVVPDNLKSGVSRAHRYEPDLNPTYAEMAAHYGVAIIPARPHAPKDKAKAENGVLVVERWILACLRHRRFFSLAELNEAIGELLDRLNERPFRKLPGSRRSRFEALDEPALGPLPAVKYIYAEWQKAYVGLDYRVEVQGHYYSVPHPLVRHTVELRITATTVECFFRGRRICSHIRDDRPGEQTIIAAHMPKAHRAYAEWTAERLLDWAGQIGEATTGLIEIVLRSRAHRQQGLRSSLGILRLSKAYGADRLEAAARRALTLGTTSYASLESILKHGLDRQALPAETTHGQPPLEHANLRGGSYYQQPSQTHERHSC